MFSPVIHKFHPPDHFTNPPTDHVLFSLQAAVGFCSFSMEINLQRHETCFRLLKDTVDNTDNILSYSLSELQLFSKSVFVMLILLPANAVGDGKRLKYPRLASVQRFFPQVLVRSEEDKCIFDHFVQSEQEVAVTDLLS